MSAWATIGVIWLFGGLLTFTIALLQGLPIIMWFIAGLLMGPLGLVPLGTAVATKRRLPRYDDGSGHYPGGAGGF